MTLKHTKGPWRRQGKDGHTIAAGSGVHERVIATLNYHTREPSPQVSVDADLIAAAPDLLEALEGLLYAAKEAWRISEGFDGRDAQVERAEAAIAKARA